MTDGKVPTAEIYRGVAIHDQQTPERIALVRREIDALLDGEWNVDALFNLAGDAANCPEARLLAAATIYAFYADRVRSRQSVPIDLDLLTSKVCLLDVEEWRSPWHFGELTDDPARAVPRDAPLPPIEEREARNRLAAS
jgi:hypothetical protein